MKLKAILFILFMASSVAGFSQKNDTDAVREVLNNYKKAIESLDISGISKLFVANSQVFEQGSDEGNISHYLAHHLGPELKEFKSFSFSDYKIDVKLAGNYAFTTETYMYTLILVKDRKETKSKGIATSVLQKVKGEWKIVQTHFSFRKAK